MDMFDADSLYHVFAQVVRLHYHRTHTLFDKIGLYPGQPGMLIALKHNEGQSQKDLADKLRIKPSTITVMLKRMEKSGFLERRQDEEDQRVSRVYLTEKGKKAYKEVSDAIKVIEQECFSNFIPEEQVLLRRLLMQMRDNLIKANDMKCDSFHTKDGRG